MIDYELINPSDPYTFRATDKETAALAVALLGLAFGADEREQKVEYYIPPFIFGGVSYYDKWYHEQFGRTPDEGLEAKKKDVAEALLSFVLGDFRDRERYNAAMEAISDPAAREAFKEKWQDGRSSMSNIGGFAHKAGERLLAELEGAKHESVQKN